MLYDYIINTSKAPLLLKPEFTSELADEALYGMTLKVIKSENIWSYIQMEYGYEGWILTENIARGSDTDWINTRNALIQSPFAELMPQNKYRGFPLKTLPRGAVVKALSENPDSEGWIQIELHDKTIGFCRKEWIRPFSAFPENTNQEAVRNAVTSDAITYMGTHYKWGGKSPSGIDCSGLTFMSYWMNGITIYRDAVIKPGYLITEIDTAERKPGDLLYFPGHIALYLGENIYVHSTGSSGGVVQNSLDPHSKLYREDLHKDLYAWGSIFA